MFSIFQITDGTPENTIDLLSDPYSIEDWTPQVADLKDGGVWQSSPFSDGRRLAFYRYSSIIDTLDLTVYSSDQDLAIAAMRKLRNLLGVARDYWVSSTVTTPIYIIARGEKETQTRYTVINDYRLPMDDDPFHPPMVNVSTSVMDELTLVLEHGFWQNEIPGTGSCITTKQSMNDQIVTRFHTYSSSPTLIAHVTRSSDAGFDNIPSTLDMTVEAWVYPDGTNTGVILAKSQGGVGWQFSLVAGQRLTFFADYAGATNAFSQAPNAELLTLNTLAHVAATLNVATKVARLFINGVECNYAGAGGSQVAGAGAYNSDAAFDLTLGCGSDLPGGEIDGKTGWIRISKSLRYTGAFTPPAQTAEPPFDANTVITTDGGIYFKARSTTPNVSASAFTIGTRANTPTDISAAPEVVSCSLPRLQLLNAFLFHANLLREHGTLYYFDTSVGTYYPITNGFPYSLPAFGAGDFLYFVSNYRVYSLFIDSDNEPFTLEEFWNGAAWVTFGAGDSDQDGVNWRAWTGRDDVFAEATYTLAPFVGKYVYRTDATHVNGIINQIPFQPSECIPYIDGSTVLGDLPAIIRFFGGMFWDETYLVDKVIIAGRSRDRGDLPCSWADGGIVTDPDNNYPSGINTTTVAGPGTTTSAFRPVTRDGSTAKNSGKYHGWLRCWQASGVSGNITATITMEYSGAVILQDTPIPLVDGGLIDLGLLDFSFADDLYNPSVSASGIAVTYTNNTAGNLDLKEVDCIMMPTDEMYFEIYGSLAPLGLFDIDTIQRPKNQRNTFSNTQQFFLDTLPITYTQKPLFSCVGLPSIPPGRDMELFAFMLNFETPNWVSKGTQHLFLGGQSVDRYQSMRGAT